MPLGSKSSSGGKKSEKNSISNISIKKAEQDKKLLEEFEAVHKKYRRKFTSKTIPEFLDTGSIGCNKCLGGGLPKGRVSEWSSPSGLGKSTLACHISKVICKSNKTVLYIDSEFAINDSLLEGTGLREYQDTLFLLHQVRGFSDVEEVMDDFLNCSKPPTLIVIDSVTTLIPTKILEGKQKIEDIEPGWQSRLMSVFFLKYKGKIAETGTHLMLINQQRYKINFKGPTILDSAGGNPLKFYPDIRIKMTKKFEIKDKEEQIGVDAEIEAIKNKFTIPFTKHLISILFGKGISNIRACTFILQKEKKIIQSGSFFTVKLGEDEKTVHGRLKLEEFLKERQDLVLDFLGKKGYL